MTFIVISIFFASNNVKEKTVQSLDNEQLVTQYFEYFNNHEWTKMVNMDSDISEFRPKDFSYFNNSMKMKAINNDIKKTGTIPIDLAIWRVKFKYKLRFHRRLLFKT